MRQDLYGRIASHYWVFGNLSSKVNLLKTQLIRLQKVGQIFNLVTKIPEI